MKCMSWILSRPPLLNNWHGKILAFVAHDKFNRSPYDGGAVPRNMEAPIDRAIRVMGILKLK